MDHFLNDEGLFVVNSLIVAIRQNKEYLSEIDGAIGDGDHGINMNKGFTLCKERLGDTQVSLTVGLKTLGRILLTEIGGSMGPLYGTFFMEMAKASEGKESIDKTVFGAMLDAALAGVQSLGNARVGDKTLLDTLFPAVEAYQTAVAEGRSFSTALERMRTAAEKGKESTRDLVAKVGRASRLGERSRGVLDAGATSCYLLLSAMAISITEYLARS
ncbi:dihydroxyacetone kinase DhaL subunit [Hydrogenispora ethanolica]|jgi:dihydroxyacetone kinase-like protein|uniref:phosphoenolpyruvate--glycerone phosphotransferase n=1 Tax=Hydrogenispora ethanolica TaxID=1082276 RepID=A0A4V2QC85_HYDET|nr:dihydroxyacetone kinase subunit DhaL [Hydrogenispora ethanolica]TCL59247.1 dihydroxyacetone kinase DhaL subunit [Hydrogenispora ethanolica]